MLSGNCGEAAFDWAHAGPLVTFPSLPASGQGGPWKLGLLLLGLLACLVLGAAGLCCPLFCCPLYRSGRREKLHRTDTRRDDVRWYTVVCPAHKVHAQADLGPASKTCEMRGPMDKGFWSQGMGISC